METAPYELYAIDPDDNGTLLLETLDRTEVIGAWVRENLAARNTTTISVEIWRDGKPLTETEREYSEYMMGQRNS